MKCRPILFSGPMVRAILDGRKTQTRRLIKPQPVNRVVDGLAHVTIGMDPSDDGALWYDADGINPGREMRCPYGRVGDRLWVRETWAIRDDVDPQNEQSKALHYALYRASYDNYLDDEWHSYSRWRPSIHMPRWASRITVEITGVRVERLKEIRDSDIVAEGLESLGSLPGTCGPLAGQFDGKYSTLRQLFSGLWVEINGAGSWDANPWVWVVEFEKVTG